MEILVRQLFEVVERSLVEVHDSPVSSAHSMGSGAPPSTSTFHLKTIGKDKNYRVSSITAGSSHPNNCSDKDILMPPSLLPTSAWSSGIPTTRQGNVGSSGSFAVAKACARHPGSLQCTRAESSRTRLPPFLLDAMDVEKKTQPIEAQTGQLRSVVTNEWR